MRIFESLKAKLYAQGTPSLDKAEQELKKLLTSLSINIQGSSKKKLREFCQAMGVQIKGFDSPASSSSSSSSSSAGFQGGKKRFREEDEPSSLSVAQLLEMAITKHNATQGTTRVSRSEVYDLFNM